MLAALVLSIQAVWGQDYEQSEEVLSVLREAADYTVEILLDQDGKSRCDYNMTEAKWYPYEEPWHTGQLIYGLLSAHEVTGNQKYLQAAQRAGEWWISLEIKEEGPLKGMLNAQHGDHAGDVIVFATVSDGTAGIFKLYDVTGDKRFAEIPTQAGEWMLENMCDLELGMCYDNVNPETGEVLTTESPFHKGKKNQGINDVARPNNEGSLFLDMYEYTGNEKFKSAFIRLCNSLIETQDEHGLWMDFIPNHKEVETFHPRFNLWYAESLIDGYELTGDKKYLAGAEETVRKYLAAQQKDGTLYYKNYLDGRLEKGSICGSAVSFLGLLMLRLQAHGVDDFQSDIDLCLKWVMKNRFTSDHSDPNLRGAFMNIRTRFRKGKHWIVNRDVGTAFGLRFLSAYHLDQTKK